MGRKRLITDSFPVVKKQRQDPDTKEGNLQPGESQASGRWDPTPAGSGNAEAAPDPPDTHLGGSLYVAPAPLEMLRQFDLSWEYGPCTGITRLQRWERAKSLGLSPPVVVLEKLLEHEGDPSFTHCLWHAYPL